MNEHDNIQKRICTSRGSTTWFRCSLFSLEPGVPSLVACGYCSWELENVGQDRMKALGKARGCRLKRGFGTLACCSMWRLQHIKIFQIWLPLSEVEELLSEADVITKAQIADRVWALSFFFCQLRMTSHVQILFNCLYRLVFHIALFILHSSYMCHWYLLICCFPNPSSGGTSWLDGLKPHDPRWCLALVEAIEFDWAICWWWGCGILMEVFAETVDGWNPAPVFR